MAKELFEPMEFFKVDKISDDIYAIASNLVLRFSVSLSKVANGKRYHFHKEFEYPVDKVDDMRSFVTIKRNFDYFLSIENIQKENGKKVFIRIGPQEFMLFKRGLEEVVSWFTDQKHSKLYATDRGKLVLMPPIPDYTVTGLSMGKYITFEPAIIDRGMANADKSPGVRIILSDPSIFVEISLEKFMGLYYIISCFNMYQAAITLLNYLERPEFGTNRVSIDVPSKASTYSEDGARQGVSGIEGRHVNPKGTKNNISLLEG